LPVRQRQRSPQEQSHIRLCRPCRALKSASDKKSEPAKTNLIRLYRRRPKPCQPDKKRSRQEQNRSVLNLPASQLITEPSVTKTYRFVLAFLNKQSDKKDGAVRTKPYQFVSAFIYKNLLKTTQKKKSPFGPLISHAPTALVEIC